MPRRTKTMEKVLCACALLLFGCSDERPLPSIDMGLSDASVDATLADDVSVDEDASAADTSPDQAGNESPATLELSFSGCAPEFGAAPVVVASGDSVAVSATDGGGSIQLALQDERGRIELSTAHRIDSGAVVNVIAGTTWTNISSSTPDPIGGTLTVREYQEQDGVMDLVFENVVLENPSDQSLCRLDGTLRSTGLSF